MAQTYSIVNGSGRILSTASGNGTAIRALGKEPAGTYVVKVTTGAGITSTAVVIAR